MNPSTLDLIYCDRLKSGLREAMRYLLEQCNWSRVDETVLLVDVIIEYNFLKSYKASYAEKLFNLIRKTDNIIPSLVCLTLIPYIKTKVERYIHELNYKDARTADDIRKIEIYKLTSKFFTTVDLLYMLSYSIGKTPYHNLTSKLLKAPLETRSIDENQVTNNIADLLGRCLTAASYMIQFLDFWNTRTNSAPLFTVSMPIPDPPVRDNYAYSDERSANTCLICLHVRKNECVLSNTGYVFCYNCIHRYVTSKQKCPITGHPSNVNNIVKLFTVAPS